MNHDNVHKLVIYRIPPPAPPAPALTDHPAAPQTHSPHATAAWGVITSRAHTYALSWYVCALMPHLDRVARLHTTARTSPGSKHRVGILREHSCRGVPNPYQALGHESCMHSHVCTVMYAQSCMHSHVICGMTAQRKEVDQCISNLGSTHTHNFISHSCGRCTSRTHAHTSCNSTSMP